MAVSKLTCPECSTVLRPSKPLPPGKKVKCPRCDTVFSASAEEEPEEERPARPVRKGPAKPRAGKAAGGGQGPSKPAGGEDEGTYGFMRDGTEDDDKPQIDYAPDMSIKDLRGPAVAILMSPTNKLTLVGFLGVFGWVALLILLMIPALFPLADDGKEWDVLEIGRVWTTGGGMGGGPGGGGGGGGDQSSKQKVEEEKPSLYEVGGVDLALLCDLAWYLFILCLIPIGLMACYSGLVAFGAIKMQNLESRGWGFASSIMAMVPINMGGLMLVSAMLIQVLLGIVFDPIADFAFILAVSVIVMTVEWLVSVGAGLYALITLFNEDVIAGFEYVAE
jgi:predicted Zn finger-like uncharacterized protein